MQEEEKKGLNDSTIALMASVAFFYDILQAFLSPFLIGLLIIPITYLHFIVWFWMHGLNFLSLKRAPTIGIGCFLEIISAGIAPSFTFTVLRIGLDSRLKNFAPKLGIIKK